MKIEVWSDVICPWCYIGRRRLEKALEQFDDRDSVEVVFRSFELDPDAALEPAESAIELLATKYGMSLAEAQQAIDRVSKVARIDGLEFHLETTRPVNTLNAHRLLQLATIRQIRPVVEERFQRAYFTEGASLADLETLRRLSTEAGLSDGDVRRVLAGQAFTLQVRTDEKEAADLGVHGVPFFVFDRTRAISGAHPIEAFRNALLSPVEPGTSQIIAGTAGRVPLSQGPRMAPSDGPS